MYVDDLPVALEFDAHDRLERFAGHAHPQAPFGHTSADAAAPVPRQLLPGAGDGPGIVLHVRLHVDAASGRGTPDALVQAVAVVGRRIRHAALHLFGRAIADAEASVADPAAGKSLEGARRVADGTSRSGQNAGEKQRSEQASHLRELPGEKTQESPGEILNRDRPALDARGHHPQRRIAADELARRLAQDRAADASRTGDRA